jgi:serine protease Do
MRSFYQLFTEDFSKRPQEIKRQLLYSPRGWGRCVFPVFATNDEESKGWGSGFFIKDLDAGITAEHLLDIEHLDLPFTNSATPNELDLSSIPFGLTANLPSQIHYFGTNWISPKYTQPARRFILDLVKKDSPMLEIRGRQKFTRRSDVLFLEFFEEAAIPPDLWRPRITAKTPQIGEWVCAIGFPNIKTQCLSREKKQVFIKDEGMALSFAQVTQVELGGRGYYESTPIAFVDSDWPGGMSGGPVFADNGRVIGVVSRELSSAGSTSNRGSFTLLHTVLHRNNQTLELLK